MSKLKFQINVKTMGTFNNLQFVTPAPYQVRDKLRRESSQIKNLWIPAQASPRRACAGMTFLELPYEYQKFWH
jgi:hypothetical protein